MTDEKRVIGICATRMNNYSRAEFLDRFVQEVKERGGRTVIFHAFEDFYYEKTLPTGAKTVFTDDLDVRWLDCMVICCMHFATMDIPRKVIEKCKKNQVPVLLLGAEEKDCYCILEHYKDTYKELIRSVIREYGIQRTFFVAGFPNNVYSDIRVQCYEEVLQEEGLPYDREKQLDYGYFWEGPAQDIAKKMVSGEELPEAVFCANDVMAMTLCKVFKENGIRVPEDVKVTGFDGIREAEYFYPSITTCREDENLLARKTVSVVFDEVLANSDQYVYFNEHILIKGESTGWKPEKQQDYREELGKFSAYYASISGHEENISNLISSIIHSPRILEKGDKFRKAIIDDSMVAFSRAFLEEIDEMPENMDTKGYELIGITRGKDGLKKEFSFQTVRDEMFKSDDRIVKVINPIYAGERVCGVFVSYNEDILTTAIYIKRICSMLNIAVSEAINRYEKLVMEVSVQEASYSYSLTGLPNLRGITKWFNTFSNDEQNRNKCLSVSLFMIPQQRDFYEKFGMAVSEEIISFVANNLKESNKEASCFIGQISDSEFLVIYYASNGNEIAKMVNQCTAVFFPALEAYNSSNSIESYIEVTCGCADIGPGWQPRLSSFIKSARAELYKNRLIYGAGGRKRTVGHVESFVKNIELFSLLIEKNLFRYAYQPIIHVETGEIYAYEALMRTDPVVGMNPLQVLDAAKECGKMYEVEKATMFNVMEQYHTENEKFHGRKVFINSIPGYFIDEKDEANLATKYGDYFNKFVFEITEQNSITEEELQRIRSLGCAEEYNQIAIDDYGTGHSNIVNLMRYEPQIVKVDRFLISEIDKDRNKQMFLKSTIEFARINNIMVLAEGVETKEELQMVIRLGVDLIQGFYTAKPEFEPLKILPVELRNEFAEAKYMPA